MTALEEIEAAIEKLTKLRDDATGSPWSVDEIPETGECRVIREFEFFGAQIENVTSGGSERLDADLIVTLHRALPEIIWLLTSIAIRLVSGSTGPLEVDHALLLARAINGGTE